MRIIFLALCLTGLITACYIKSEHKSPYTWTKPEFVGDVPASFTWGDNDGVNYLTQMKNQHFPHHCGSCWAQASTSVISDRISIMRKGVFPEINIAAQPFLDCDTGNNGCEGGSHLKAFEYVKANGITDETCAPYQALSWKEGKTCEDVSICKECAPGGAGCGVPKKFNTYKISEYGALSGEADMMAEIFARGPIACAVDGSVVKDVMNWDIVTAKGTSVQHVISVVGWGIDNGQKFWIIRNSFGEFWGQEGWARLAKGDGGAAMIETDCAYAVPIDTWENQPLPHASAEKKTKKNAKPKTVITDFGRLLENLYNSSPRSHPDGLISDETNPNKLDLPEEVVISAKPEDYIDSLDVPDAFWWGNVKDTNFLSWTVNQHVPQYCGSCWAQAAQSAFADRVNIKYNNAFPRVAMSVQQILNCGAGGSCEGGSLNGVYQYGHRNYLVEIGCQVYEAKDPARQDCSPVQICGTCMNFKNPFKNDDTCHAVTSNFRKWKVKEYGRITGKDKMKKEIFARGPITCGMDATDKFYKTYQGGIWSQKVLFPTSNHAISVNGWGKDGDTEYWIVRNSWGTWWGESGYFRIDMHHGSLGIGHEACFWAVPELL